MTPPDPFDEYPELRARAYPPPALPPEPLPDASAMPEEFAKSTILALRAQQEILAMALDENDPNYRAKLSAKASVSSQQISAQLKADEQRLRGQLAVTSYYQELKKALEDFRARK